METITRYAPSPTGNPHVGNIRTAIFAYLHAKSKNGKFLLRIEDTDRARFVPEAIHYIEESLNWLGIKYDDEKVFQSERLPVYQKYAEQLISEGKAYKCFCSSERLEELRAEQEAKKLPPGYDSKCRNLSKEEAAKLEAEKAAFVIRFAMPKTGKASWNDLVRDQIEIDFKTQEDFIIIKSDGWPTYNFANVIDDHELEISTIIRGEEFIPSTPKHIALYEALGWNPPEFAHMPHIVGADRSKLSKRHGDTAILDYKEKGYLPEAMFNFLATLGWNDGTEKEIFTRAELEKAFDVKRIGKSPAVFDLEKLNWLNGQYIRSASISNLKIQISKLIPKLSLLKLENFDRILEVEKSRLVTLCDIQAGTEYFLDAPKNVANIIVFKKSTAEDTKRGLKAVSEALDNLKEELDVTGFESLLKKAVEQEGLSNGDVFWPVRVALSGKEKSPSPAELLWVLGATESKKRIETVLEQLK